LKEPLININHYKTLQTWSIVLAIETIFNVLLDQLQDRVDEQHFLQMMLTHLQQTLCIESKTTSCTDLI